MSLPLSAVLTEGPAPRGLGSSGALRGAWFWLSLLTTTCGKETTVQGQNQCMECNNIINTRKPLPTKSLIAANTGKHTHRLTFETSKTNLERHQGRLTLPSLK